MRSADAARAPRREADRVARRPEAAAHAVDPTEAERLIDRLRPGEARLAGADLVQADQQLRRLGVIRGQPGAKGCRRRKKDGLQEKRPRCSCHISDDFVTPSRESFPERVPGPRWHCFDAFALGSAKRDDKSRERGTTTTKTISLCRYDTFDSIHNRRRNGVLMFIERSSSCV